MVLLKIIICFIIALIFTAVAFAFVSLVMSVIGKVVDFKDVPGCALFIIIICLVIIGLAFQYILTIGDFIFGILGIE